jgi:hypothetical protein
MEEYLRCLHELAEKRLAEHPGDDAEYHRWQGYLKALCDVANALAEAHVVLEVGFHVTGADAEPPCEIVKPQDDALPTRRAE